MNKNRNFFETLEWLISRNFLIYIFVIMSNVFAIMLNVSHRQERNGVNEQNFLHVF